MKLKDEKAYLNVDLMSFNNGVWNSSVSFENIDFYGFENTILEFTQDSLFLIVCTSTRTV